MSYLVTLDFGNTSAKASLFFYNQKEERLIRSFSPKDLLLILKEENLNSGDVGCILCEVKPYPEIIKNIQEMGIVIESISDWWKGKAFNGMKVNYQTTLGTDRLILAHYAYKEKNSINLVIDAGSFITIDVVSHPEGFQGGYILPGFQNIQNSYSLGAQLKHEISLPSDLTHLPNNTSEALSGFHVAVFSMIQNHVDSYNPNHIFLTGGDASIIKKILLAAKINLPIIEDPHMIHFALLYWWKKQGRL